MKADRQHQKTSFQTLQQSKRNGGYIVDNRSKAISQSRLIAAIQLKKGDEYIGFVSDSEEPSIKIIGKTKEFKIAPSELHKVTGTKVRFTEGENEMAISIETMPSPEKELKEIKKLSQPAINGKLGYREYISELLNSPTKNVITHEPRFLYDPEKGVSIGQVLLESQNRLPIYTKQAWKDGDMWKMKTVGPPSERIAHQEKNADGIYDFVMDSPLILKMIKRQEGGAGHSSFGNAHLMAGEVKFNNGELIEWSTRSGHFMPPEELCLQTGLDRSLLVGYQTLVAEKTLKTGLDPISENLEQATPPQDSWVSELRSLIEQIKLKYANEIEDLSSHKRPNVALGSFIVNTDEIKEFVLSQKEKGYTISNTMIKKYI